MIPHRPRENVFALKSNMASSNGSSPSASQLSASKSPKLHPGVRRRRLTWLTIMSLFILWAIVQISYQQWRIWEKEEQLAAKQATLKELKQETKSLQKEIQLLHDENYLLELAHKYGYGKKGEKTYQLNETD